MTQDFPVSFLAGFSRGTASRLWVELISLHAATAAYLITSAATRDFALYTPIPVESEAFGALPTNELVVTARAVRCSALVAGAVIPLEALEALEADALMAL